MSADDEQKLKRLNAVFVKALDMTTDSITQIELKESFQAETGSISSVENMFVNTIGKMKLSVEGKFSALCQEQGSVAIQAHGVIVEKENAPNQKARSGNMTDELQACEREILAREIEKVSSNRIRMLYVPGIVCF